MADGTIKDGGAGIVNDLHAEPSPARKQMDRAREKAKPKERTPVHQLVVMGSVVLSKWAVFYPVFVVGLVVTAPFAALASAYQTMRRL